MSCFNFGSGNGSCCWIIILILLFLFGGNNGTCGDSSNCGNNNCGCC